MTFNFSNAISSLFIGRCANVPKPQSGFNRIFSSGKIALTSFTRATISSTDSTSTVLGLMTPKPNDLSPMLLIASISPARGVAYSRAS